MRRSLPALALAVALVLGTSACGEEGPRGGDAGSGQGVPLAGVGRQVAAAGVEVISADAPSGATGTQVSTALDDAGATVADDAVLRPGDLALPLGVDGTATAGLVAAVLPDPTSGSVAVLVFATPSAAAVFASEPPSALEAGTDRRLLLAGNLVAVSDRGGIAAVRTALDALAGVTVSPSATPSATPSTSTSPASPSSSPTS
ncbi:hypothetical protein ABFT23_11375 [Nocardioides sp. C4-1]|uniref:hypothetical protein n=1 Tax=Nocardioides sp. C4-1 TaxID=3151851 RepID=UPI003263C0C1